MKTEKKYSALLAALSVLAFSACEKEETPAREETPLQEENLVEVTFSVQSPDTKSTFDGRQISWESTDKVAIYDGVARRQFSVTSISADGHSATLSGSVDKDATEFHAVYPYSAARETLPSEGKIYVTLPKEQKAAAGKGFDPDAFVSVGKADAEGNIAFKNIVSVLKLNIPDNVTSVSLKGFNTAAGGDRISGAATVTYTDGTPSTVAITGYGENYPSIEMTPDGGGTFTAGAHYMALLPNTFTKGFKVVFANNSNKISIKKNTGSVPFPLNGGNDISAYTTAEALSLWLPNPIMTEADLLEFVGNQAAYAGEEALIGADIDLTSSWTPVNLSGILDGQNHTISGLDVSTSATACMFSIVTGAVLKNVTVEGTITMNATSGNKPAGLVGELHGTMHNVTNRTAVNVTSTTGNCYAGGLAGWIYRGTMTECVNEGNVTIGTAGDKGYAGGVAGVIYPDGLVENCVNTGTVTSTATSTNGLGGVIGTLQAGVVRGSDNRGTVVAENMRSTGGVGGVVGAVYNNSNYVTTVDGCDNDGTITVTATGFMAVGGIVGTLSDGEGRVKEGEVKTPSAAEILNCENKQPITLASFTKTAGASGMDGFYLGGIVGSINAGNDSTIENKVQGCTNSGNLSVTTTGSNNAIKLGGICGNVRGVAIIKGNENAASSVSLVSSSAKSLLCSVGGIVGETGDPWSNDETTEFTLTDNVNKASVLSKTNVTETPAGGLIGYCFGPVTATGNKNFGSVTRAAADGSSPSGGSCFAGGLVGFFSVHGSSRGNASFVGNMTFGDVSSNGRAAILFGGLRSNSYANFNFNNCVIAGHLVSPHHSYDLDITASNFNDNSGKMDGSYLWSYIPAKQYGLTISGISCGNAADYY